MDSRLDPCRSGGIACIASMCWFAMKLWETGKDSQGVVLLQTAWCYLYNKPAITCRVMLHKYEERQFHSARRLDTASVSQTCWVA